MKFNVEIKFTNTPPINYSGIEARDLYAAKRIASNYARRENPAGVIKSTKAKEV